MSEPRRLIDSGAGDFERALLDSARWDAPRPTARHRTLLALGLGTGIVGASVSTASASAASVGAWALLKWVGAGVVAGLVVVGTAGRVLPPPEVSAPSIVAPQANAPREAPQLRAEERASVSVPSPDLAKVEAPAAAAAPIEAAKATEAERIAKPATNAPGTNAPATKSTKDASESKEKETKETKETKKAASLSDEVSFLDQAQKALASGSAGRALEILAAHDGEIKALRIEATVLRIEALAARGDRAGAASMAQAFLTSFPRSPHANRVRSILEATGGTPPAP